MGRTFAAGLLVVAAAVVAIVLSGVLGLGLGSVLFGVAVGGALALAPNATAAGRAGAFVVGFLICAVGYVVRALFLNDSTLGQIIYVALVVLAVTAVCAVIPGNALPLWAGLLGIAALTGAYEAAYTAAPQDLNPEIIQYGSKVLLPASLAFLAALFVIPIRGGSEPEAVGPPPSPQAQGATPSEVR